MQTFAEIIGQWPNAEALADDLGEKGVTVRAWRRRDTIPADRWFDLIEAAERRGIKGVTSDLLVRLSSHRGAPAPTPPTDPQQGRAA